LEALRAALVGAARQLHANAVDGGASAETGGAVAGARHKRRIAKQFLEAMAAVAQLPGSSALQPRVIRTAPATTEFVGGGRDGLGSAQQWRQQQQRQLCRGGMRSDLAAGCVLATVGGADLVSRHGVVESAAGKWGVLCVALEVKKRSF
jgi:hypothetical protein